MATENQCVSCRHARRARNRFSDEPQPQGFVCSLHDLERDDPRAGPTALVALELALECLQVLAVLGHCPRYHEIGVVDPDMPDAYLSEDLG